MTPKQPPDKQTPDKQKTRKTGNKADDNPAPAAEPAPAEEPPKKLRGSRTSSTLENNTPNTRKQRKIKKDTILEKIPENLPTLRSLYKNRDLLWLFSRALITADHLDSLEKWDSIYSRMISEKNRLAHFIGYPETDDEQVLKLAERLYNHFDYVETVMNSRENWEKIDDELKNLGIEYDSNETLDELEKDYEHVKELYKQKNFSEFTQEELKNKLDKNKNIYKYITARNQLENEADRLYKEIGSWGFDESILQSIVENEAEKGDDRRIEFYEKVELPEIVSLEEINGLKDIKSGPNKKKKDLALFLYDILIDYINDETKIADHIDKNDEGFVLQVAEDDSKMVKIMSYDGRYLINSSGEPLFVKRPTEYGDLTYDQLLTNIDFLNGLVKGTRGFTVAKAFEKLDGIYDWMFDPSKKVPDSYKAYVSGEVSSEEIENGVKDSSETYSDSRSAGDQEDPEFKPAVNITYDPEDPGLNMPDKGLLYVPQVFDSTEAYRVMKNMEQGIKDVEKEINDKKIAAENETDNDTKNILNSDIEYLERTLKEERKRLKKFKELNDVPNVAEQERDIRSQLSSVIGSLIDLNNLEDTVSMTEILDDSLSKAKLRVVSKTDNGNKVDGEEQNSGNLRLSDLGDPSFQDTLQESELGLKLINSLVQVGITINNQNNLDKELIEKIINLNDTVTRLKQENAAKEASLIKLDQDSVTKKEQIKALSVTVKELRNSQDKTKIDALNTENALLKRQNQKLEEFRWHDQNIRLGLVGQLNTVRKNAADQNTAGLVEQVADFAKTNARLNSQIIDLNRNVTNIEARLNVSQSENMGLRRKIDSMNNEKRRLLSESKEREEYLINEIDTLKHQKDENETEVFCLTGNLLDAYGSIDTLTEERDKLIRTLTKERESFEELEKRAMRRADDIENNSQSIERLERELADERTQNAVLGYDKLTLANENTRLGGEIERLEQKTKDYEKLQEQIDSLNGVINAYRQRLVDYDKTITKLIGNPEKIFLCETDILFNLQTYIESLKKDERDTRSRIEEVKRDYEDQINQLIQTHEVVINQQKLEYDQQLEYNIRNSLDEQNKIRNTLEKTYQQKLEEIENNYKSEYDQLTAKYTDTVGRLEGKVKQQDVALRGMFEREIDEYYKPFFNSARVVLTEFNDLVADKATENIPILKELFGVFIGDIKDRLQDKRRTEMEMFRHNLNLAQEAAKHSYDQQRRSETHAYRIDLEDRTHSNSMDLVRERQRLREGGERWRWEAERDRDEARGFRGTSVRAVRNRYVSSLIGGLVGSNNPVAVAQGYALLTEFAKSLMELPDDELNNPDVDSFLNMYDQGSLDKLVAVLSQQGSNTVNDALAKRMSDLENTTRSFINMVSQRTAHVGAAQTYHPPRRVFVGRDGVAHQGNKYTRRRGANNRKLPPRKSNGQFKRASSRRSGNKRK